MKRKRRKTEKKKNEQRISFQNICGAKCMEKLKRIQDLGHQQQQQEEEQQGNDHEEEEDSIDEKG